VRVKILEIDSERRRLSLSIKRVEGQVLPVRPIIAPTESEIEEVPELGLSEDVFADAAVQPSEAAEAVETIDAIDAVESVVEA
jgi:small subunit ribosomal protein S1